MRLLHILHAHRTHRYNVDRGVPKVARVLATCLIGSNIFLGALTAWANTPAGEMVAVKVRLEAKPEPKKAMGIFFSPTSSRQFSETTISKIGDKLYEISFSVPAGLVREDSVASALGFDESGTVSFANVTPALPSESRDLLASIPECPGEDGAKVAGLTSPGTLQQLIDVRSERMSIARFKIARIMDQNFLAKLRKFEDAFGLTYSTELSPDLPPADLIERLSKINNAVRKYQQYKTKPTK